MSRFGFGIERIVADALVRVLGEYVQGISPESVSVGVLKGHLELHGLSVLPEAIAVLFESLGLDLPVVVVAGSVGTLSLRLNWASLRSSPVLVSLTDVAVVAAPVSDGDQAALAERAERLKAARLTTDDTLRSARFSVAAAAGSLSRIRRRLAGGLQAVMQGVMQGVLTDIVANVHVSVQNVVVQYQDASSVRDTPYTVSLALRSVRAASTDALWAETFPHIFDPRPKPAPTSAPAIAAPPQDDAAAPPPPPALVFKVVHLDGLVANWVPGTGDDSYTRLDPRAWADAIRADARRRVIHPVTGRLRLSLPSADTTDVAAVRPDASADAGVAVATAAVGDLSVSQSPQLSPPLSPSRSPPSTPQGSASPTAAAAAAGVLARARIELDLCFPDVHLAFDDFQYHCLLSTIMYLSDIDRKVRPKDPRARWFWALDRLLPRFKERHEARVRFSAEGLRERREQLHLYVRSRKKVVQCRHAGAHVDSYAHESSTLAEMEGDLSLQDVLLFRDIADRQIATEMLEAANPTQSADAGSSRGWLFGRTRTRSRGRGRGRDGRQVDDWDGADGNPIFPDPVPDLADGRTGSLAATSPVASSPELLDEGERLTRRLSVRGLGRRGGSARRANRRALARSQSVEHTGGGAFGGRSRPTSPNRPRARARGNSSAGNSGESMSGSGGTDENSHLSSSRRDDGDISGAPSMRLGFLLGRGSIQLSSGGHVRPPLGMSRLEFHELRLGVMTWAESGGMVIEALLGTLDVLDLRAPQKTKVFFPRVEWAGYYNEEECVNGDSYPTETSRSLAQICGSREKAEASLFNPTRAGLQTPAGMCSPGSDSSTSSGSSEGNGMGHSGTREDLTRSQGERLSHVVALRLKKEAVATASGSQDAKRLVMELGIGGMETLVDGPSGAFVSSFLFWHPREKLPSIMNFLGRSAAPRLAALRMDIQRMLLDKKAPMRMNIFIRAPRFVLPGPEENKLSLVVDLGTFAMETTDGIALRDDDDGSIKSSEPDIGVGGGHRVDLSCTNYRMTGSDLGVFVVTGGNMRVAERLVKPFSLRILLQVLNEAAYLEAVMDHILLPSLAKVRMFGRLSSLKTTISQKSFRSLLKIAHKWSSISDAAVEPSGIEPNSPRLSTGGLASPSASMPSPLSLSGSAPPSPVSSRLQAPASPGHLEALASESDSRLIAFDMRVQLDDLRLELRDSSNRRVVTVSSKATEVRFSKGDSSVVVNYRVREFVVEDGSRGATAPFRRLLYAGTANVDDERDTFTLRDARPEDSFVTVRYQNDVKARVQGISVHVLSLSMVCVRETYLALADFFYRGDESSQDSPYVDPFSAVGMTTSSAVQALRTQAERGVEMSKRALAERGSLHVSAMLEGFDITLITAEGAIASFDVSGCAVKLSQTTGGDIRSSGGFESLRVRDLTAAFDFHSQTITYTRDISHVDDDSSEQDGWVFELPREGEMWLRSRMTNLRIVYLQRFIVILKQYIDALRDELQPVLSMKGGISEVFDADAPDAWTDISASPTSRLRLDVVTRNVDVIMPRHSQAPHEALRFVVEKSTVKNDELPAPGYQIGIRLAASAVSSYALFADPDKDGDNIVPLSFAPLSGLVPFSTETYIVGKLDLWRCRRVPEVVLNDEGNPVLKDGEHERDYDPQQWIPALRARLFVPTGLTARLCEAEYSILYFVFTENIIERPEIEFTDMARGLKTPILPPRRPINPLMLASHRLPAQYSVVFEVSSISSIIAHGANPALKSANLISSELRNLEGRFDYGVDSRMGIELACDLKHVEDLRKTRKRHQYVIQCGSNRQGDKANGEKSVTLSWDRPFGHRANVMLLVSGMKVIVVPELFRDLGMLTSPGIPYLTSSAPAPYLRFNGRLLIVTLSSPEIIVPADEHDGDHRGLVIRGDVIAKVQWAAVTGRRLVDIAANRLRVGLSSALTYEDAASVVDAKQISDAPQETPLLYPLDLSVNFHAGGYDPPPSPKQGEDQEGEPTRAPGSTLSVIAESVLGRIDVNDTATLLAVALRLALTDPSPVSKRPRPPGRFDKWKDVVEEGDAKLSIHCSVPQARVLFTDEAAGRFVPIMELQAQNTLLRSNVPWLTHARFDVSLYLFNEKKRCWEPGVEQFPVDLTASQGRSGSIAVNARANEGIFVNVSPSTVSGAARVGKTIKFGVDELRSRLVADRGQHANARPGGMSTMALSALNNSVSARKRRPSVAAFCVKNSTGHPVSVWRARAHDSTRRHLRGDGAEVEIDKDTGIWSGVADTAGLGGDTDQDRDGTVRCFVSFSGYRPVSLSVVDMGVKCVSLSPEPHDRAVDTNSMSDLEAIPPLIVAWDVSMRDGVPVGCLRSVVRVLNESGTPLEFSVGSGLSKSISASFDAMNTYASSDLVGSSGSPSYALIQSGDAWCIPIQYVGQPVRLRPADYRAPDEDEEDMRAEDSFRNRRDPSLLYSYHLSEALGKVEDLRHLARMNSDPTLVMSCASTSGSPPFSFTLRPIVARSLTPGVPNMSSAASGWLDLRIQAPIVVRNRLPRALNFAITDAHAVAVRRSGVGVLASKELEPDRETPIYTAGSDLRKLAFGVGYQNISDFGRGSSHEVPLRPGPVSTSLGTLDNLKIVPVGSRRTPSLKLRLDTSGSAASRVITVFADFWIQNLSDVDLFFKDASVDPRGSSGTDGRPKTFLRGCPPGAECKPFVCFTGSWLSFQRADSITDVWVHVEKQVKDIDGPVRLPFHGLGLSMDVRPARGDFQRSLIATIRNTGWIRNKTNFHIQWCQPAALNSRMIALSSNVHTIGSGEMSPLHWDFYSEERSVCLRRVEPDGSSAWFWSQPVAVENVENGGEFAAKMYQSVRHEQYLARAVVTRVKPGIHIMTVHPEDRRRPPYRIVNQLASRSIAFRQSSAEENSPWLVRPGKSSRYSWDDPRAPVKRRTLIVQFLDTPSRSRRVTGTGSVPNMGVSFESDTSGSREASSASFRSSRSSSSRSQKFELSIDEVSESLHLPGAERLAVPVLVSVSVDGPTKVVVFSDRPVAHPGNGMPHSTEGAELVPATPPEAMSVSSEPGRKPASNVDIEVFIKSVGISVIDGTPVELMYATVYGILFKLDRFDTSELVIFEIADVQVDNQLASASWPVLLWSPPPPKSNELVKGSNVSNEDGGQKPFLQVIGDGKHPWFKSGISRFRGIFVAVQHIELAADEELALRLLMCVQSLLEASGEGEYSKNEDLSSSRADEYSERQLVTQGHVSNTRDESSVLTRRLHVEQLELCPLRVTVSFSSSRSAGPVHVPGYRTLRRTLIALFGNVENAECRFNALELRHVFDTALHFRSLVGEFYLAQLFGQKMTLLASNALVGNPSALFDSIALGTRDFFVEPARARGTAEFMAGIGRGSSSLLTNTVGGIVGSLGGIPRAVAQGLETAVGDTEYLATRESIRGRARFASSPAQGLYTGALSFGHGIASGATGLLRDPVLGAMESGPSGFIKGLGKGVVGGVLKPITGALDLIGEPAVGFRSMMTTMNRSFAEPVRPPRSFKGVCGNQLVPYDLHDALGQAILNAAGRIANRDGSDVVLQEQLWAWIPLVSVNDNAKPEDLVEFLWALHRQSSPRSQLRSKAVIDALGEPQRADKVRCALITQLRLIVASLDGTILWERGLQDIVDTQVTVEASDSLMVGLRPPGATGRRRDVAPAWERISCGSLTRRDAVNAALKKALLSSVDAGMEAHFTRDQISLSPSGRDIGEDTRASSRRDARGDIEMIEMSAVDRSTPESSAIPAGGSHSETAVGAGLQRPQKTASESVAVSVSPKQAPFDVFRPTRQNVRARLSPRSLMLSFYNSSGTHLDVVRYSLTSGIWVSIPPEDGIAPGATACCEVGVGVGDVFDLSGGIVFRYRVAGMGSGPRGALNERSVGLDDGSGAITFYFNNPMLASNAFSVAAPSGVTVNRFGGDHGDHADVHISISRDRVE